MTLDLGHRPALGRDDFLVAPCNAEAVAWLERWPHWPHHALALFGPQGCGKTHLLAVFAQHHDLATIIIPASQLTADDSLHMQLPPVTMIDNLDDLVDETALFHLWNRTKEAGTHLLLAGRTAPARLPVHLPDLRSRLASLHAVGIGAPDESLLAAVLIKLFPTANCGWARMWSPISWAGPSVVSPPWANWWRGWTANRCRATRRSASAWCATPWPAPTTDREN